MKKYQHRSYPTIDVNYFGVGPCKPVWSKIRKQWIFTAKLNECDLDITNEDIVDRTAGKSVPHLVFGKTFITQKTELEKQSNAILAVQTIGIQVWAWNLKI